MRDIDRERLWRTLSYSAAPFLTIFAVLLLRMDDTLSLVLGVTLLIAAVLAIAVPLLVRRKR